MLSWVRTATALISFGFSIQQFFRITRAGAPERDQIDGPDEFGFAMIVVGLLALLLAALKHWFARVLLEVPDFSRDEVLRVLYKNAPLAS